MSYTAFGAEECPPGWTWDPGAQTCRTPDASAGCPAGFDQRVPGECWPSTPSACKTLFGTFYNPAEPDRCKQTCPAGLEPDDDHVCRPRRLGWRELAGLAILGVVAVVVVKGAR